MSLFWKLLRRMALVCLVAGVGLLGYLRLGKDFAKEIRNRKVVHTAAGWVNYGHANPESVKLFIEDLRHQWRTAGSGTFEMTYGQQMSGEYFGLITVEARLERSYHITQVLTQEDLNRIAWGIFRDVSEAFETMQGEFPNAIDAASQDSSFRNGDLMGNRIAFYRALRGYSKTQVEEWIQPQSVEGSLFHLHETSFRPKNRSWDILPAMAGTPLDEVRHDSVWFSNHAAVVREKQSWFKIGVRDGD